MNETRTGGVVDRLLGIVAGSLGFLSILLPWVSIYGFGIPLISLLDTDLTRFYIAPGVTDADRPVFSVAFFAFPTAALVLLIVGSLVSFFWRGGGFLILIAWLGFVVWFYALLPAPPRSSFGYGAGFYLAVVASFVSLSRYALKLFFRPNVPPADPGVPTSGYQNPPPPP